MSILHRRRAVLERIEQRNAGRKRGPLPIEFKRSSEQPPVPHEREAASVRTVANDAAAAKKRLPKKTARRR